MTAWMGLQFQAIFEGDENGPAMTMVRRVAAAAGPDPTEQHRMETWRRLTLADAEETNAAAEDGPPRRLCRKLSREIENVWHGDDGRPIVKHTDELHVNFTPPQLHALCAQPNTLRELRLRRGRRRVTAVPGHPVNDEVGGWWPGFVKPWLLNTTAW